MMFETETVLDRRRLRRHLSFWRLAAILAFAAALGALFTNGDTLASLTEKHGLEPSQVAFMGDDLLDIPALQRVGLAMAPANAVPEARAVAHVVTKASGGAGAVREAIELILRAQGLWTKAVRAFVLESGGLDHPWK